MRRVFYFQDGAEFYVRASRRDEWDVLRAPFAVKDGDMHAALAAWEWFQAECVRHGFRPVGEDA